MTSVLRSNINQHCKPLGPEIFQELTKNTIIFESSLDMKNGVANALARADRGSDPSERRNKIGNALDGTAILDFLLLYVSFWTSLWSLKYRLNLIATHFLRPGGNLGLLAEAWKNDPTTSAAADPERVRARGPMFTNNEIEDWQTYPCPKGTVSDF